MNEKSGTGPAPEKRNPAVVVAWLGLIGVIGGSAIKVVLPLVVGINTSFTGSWNVSSYTPPNGTACAPDIGKFDLIEKAGMLDGTYRLNCGASFATGSFSGVVTQNVLLTRVAHVEWTNSNGSKGTVVWKLRGFGKRLVGNATRENGIPTKFGWSAKLDE